MVYDICYWNADCIATSNRTDTILLVRLRLGHTQLPPVQGGATNSGTLATEVPESQCPHVTRWRERTLQSDNTGPQNVLCEYCLSEYKESCCSVIKVPGVEACGRHGVEITFNVAVQAASLVQAKIPPRLASVHMKEAIVMLTVISVYDPTLDTEEEAKNVVVGALT